MKSSLHCSLFDIVSTLMKETQLRTAQRHSHLLRVCLGALLAHHALIVADSDLIIDTALLLRVQYPLWRLLHIQIPHELSGQVTALTNIYKELHHLPSPLAQQPQNEDLVALEIDCVPCACDIFPAKTKVDVLLHYFLEVTTDPLAICVDLIQKHHPKRHFMHQWIRRKMVLMHCGKRLVNWV
eukprot:m.168187 g.168187  ORF g.168187 m.168187 type:complete len:183 (+) comp16465_c0_seq3:1846-2394(+)